MSKQYPAGIISKTAVTPSGPYEDSSASGVWTLDQQAYWNKQGLWPTAGSTQPDAYFNYVTMLLHGDGANAAQNNTFVDSSSNAFSITRNGNTTQGTFTPYGSNWSNYFAGGSNYLDFPTNAAYGMGTGDFTIEAWLYPTAAWAGSGSYNPIFLVNGTGGLYFGQNSAGFGLRQSGTANIISYATSPALNTWTHVAIVRSGTTVTMYYNGASVATATSSANFTSGTITVGYDGSYTIPAQYISNLRIVKGTAVYTGAFTPSTTPLTAISGTSLLICQSNRLVDNSSNAAAITVTGSPSVQRFSPFSPTTAYSTSVIGGSGYFDGTGDYLSTPGNAAFNFGSGNFTVEAWVYRTTLGAFTVISDVQYWYAFGLRVDSNGVAYSYGFNSSTSSQNWYCISANNVVPVSTWCHLALVRNGSSIIVYANGVNVASTTFSGASAGTTSSVRIAHNDSAVEGTGYVTDARIVKGTAVYTTAFTPPTAPLTAITNTSLLLNFTNAGILDNAEMNDLETVGNAQISTSVVKYGTGSMYFDGTSSSLNFFANLQNLQFGTGDFTIECWVNKSANGANAYDCAIGLGSTVNATQGWYLEISTSRGIYFAINSTSLSYGTWANDGAWHHIAVTRSNGTAYIFKDGTLLTSGALTTAVPTSATAARIGNYYNGSTNYYYSGYIDDLRITKGYARYTANFTAPTKAFANK